MKLEEDTVRKIDRGQICALPGRPTIVRDHIATVYQRFLSVPRHKSKAATLRFGNQSGQQGASGNWVGLELKLA